MSIENKTWLDKAISLLSEATMGQVMGWRDIPDTFDPLRGKAEIILSQPILPTELKFIRTILKGVAKDNGYDVVGLVGAKRLRFTFFKRTPDKNAIPGIPS